MNRGSSSRLRALGNNTLLIGGVALVIVAVALAISFQAQNGLPFVPTYDIHADVPDAAKLSKNADVRIGGARVGQVLAIHAEPGGNGHPPYARLDLALNSSVGPLPADSTVEVRLASVLGGKFVDLVPGTRRPGVGTIPDSGVLPLAQGLPSVDTDEALQVFGPASRLHIRAMIGELADGLAGRGPSLNRFLHSTARLLPAGIRVLRVFVAPRTDLAGFIEGVADTAGAIAPIAPALGRVIDRSARAFAAIEAADGSLDEALGGLPSTEQTATGALTALRPVLDDAANVTRSLRGAGPLLPGTLQDVDTAVRAATPVDRGAGRLAPSLDAALRAVDRFSADPASMGAIQALKGEDLATFGGSAFIGLGAVFHTVATAQLNCNIAALWMRNLASIGDEGDSGGNWLRMIPVFVTNQTSHSATPDTDLHVNYYPHENSHECEAGNEPFSPGRAIGNPPGNQSTSHEVTKADGSG